MKGSSYSLRVMKNAKQYSNKHSPGAGAGGAQGNNLEVPGSASGQVSKWSVIKIIQLFFEEIASWLLKK
jgi:hypothetical protein